MNIIFLFTASFLASSVEMVEALTIILATGITRGWRSAFIGAATAAVALGLIIVVFGITLTAFVPLNLLRVVIGTFLLIFGLQWLRKAILRYSGLKSLRDEAALYQHGVNDLAQTSPTSAGLIDWMGFTVAFKGVFLEGLEVAFIVITLGSSAQTGPEVSGVAVAALGAFVALALVAIVGLVAHRPLAEVPENTMKFVVGLMLVAFGTFWAGEGVGIEWIGGDVAIPVILAVYGLISWAAIVLLRRRTPVAVAV